VAVDVPGPACRRGLVVGMGRRAGGAEAADTQRTHRSLGTAGNHDVGVAVFDQARRLAEAVVGRRTGADGGEVRPLLPVMNRHQASDHVDDRSRHEERRYLAQSALEIGTMRVLDHRKPADAGTDTNAYALQVPAISIEPGTGDRLHRGHLPVVHEPVIAARVLAGQILGDVEILDLPGDTRGKSRGVEPCDGNDAGPAGENVLPRSGDAGADRRHDTYSGDCNSASGHESIVDRRTRSRRGPPPAGGRAPAPARAGRRPGRRSMTGCRSRLPGAGDATSSRASRRSRSPVARWYFYLRPRRESRFRTLLPAPSPTRPYPASPHPSRRRTTIHS